MAKKTTKVTATDAKGCMAVVHAALPDVPGALLKEIADGMEVELKYSDSMDMQVALQRATDAVITKRERNLKARKFQEYKNIASRKHIAEYIDQNFADNPFKGHEARRVGIQGRAEGSRLSADGRQHALRERYHALISGDLTEKGIINDVMDPDNTKLHEEIAIEMERIGQENVLPDTGNDVAKTAAAIFHRVQELARIDANDAGANIGKLVGRISRQAHDMFRIREMGYKQWSELTDPLLDWERIEKSLGRVIKDRNKFLKTVYQGISTGVHMRHWDGIPGKTVSENLAKQLSHERVLHFKPGKWMEYNNAAGSRSIIESIAYDLERSAMTTGLMQVWGPSAEYNMRQTFSDLKSKYPEHTGKNEQKLLDYNIAELTGQTRIPANASLAARYSGLRLLQNYLRMGGSAVTAALTDPMIMSAEFKRHGASRLKGYGEALRSDFTGVSGKERQVKMRAMGIMAEGIISRMHNRMDYDNIQPGWMTNANTRLFKWNLLTPHTDRLRAGTAEALTAMAADYADTGFTKLPKEYRHILSLYEIGEPEWNLMRKYGVQSFKDGDIDTGKMMTQEALHDIPDDAIRNTYPEMADKNGNISDYRVREKRNEIIGKYQSYLIDRVGHGVLTMDAKASTVQRAGQEAGTHLGGLIGLFMQFKGFPILFTQKVLGAEIYGAETKGKAFMNVAHLIWQSALLGYGVMAVKDMLKGKEPPDITDPDVIREAMLRGGGLGFYGDILFGELRKEWGKGAIGAIAGPTAGTVDDFADLLARARDGDLTASKAVKTIYRNATPNLFYLKPALDYLILYQLMEMTDPGSVRKMEKRFETQHDRQYFDFASPSEAVR